MFVILFSIWFLSFVLFQIWLLLKFLSISHIEIYRFLFYSVMCSVLCHFSHVWLFGTPWTVALQAPLSMGFSQQEYCIGLPCLPPGLELDELLQREHICVSEEYFVPVLGEVIEAFRRKVNLNAWPFSFVLLEYSPSIFHWLFSLGYLQIF